MQAAATIFTAATSHHAKFDRKLIGQLAIVGITAMKEHLEDHEREQLRSN